MSRWQEVLSKNFWLTRLRKLFTVHGASALSKVRFSSPTEVSSVTGEVPLALTLPLSGALMFSLLAGSAPLV